MVPVAKRGRRSTAADSGRLFANPANPANLHDIFELLFSHYGAQHWWPVDASYHKYHGTDSRFEIMVGAVLTQNTSWTNVEKALCNLKSIGALSIESIVKLSLKALADAMRVCGYYNQKAQRIKGFANHLLEKHGGDIDAFFSQEPDDVRGELLSIRGIGPETADSILLYAGGMPFFVVDGYTKRLCRRMPLRIVQNAPTFRLGMNIKSTIRKRHLLQEVSSLHCAGAGYEQIRYFFEEMLASCDDKKELPSLFNEFHALIVRNAKEHCKTKPLCRGCPLLGICEMGQMTGNVSNLSEEL